MTTPEKRNELSPDLERDKLFEEWCPVTILDESKAPKAAALKRAYKNAWDACWREAMQVQRESDATIADEFANSKSCKHHDENPCCHVRTGATIAARIRGGNRG